MGTQNLPRAVGEGRAKEIILTGLPFSAEDGLQWGMINTVCANEALLDETLATATRIAENAPLAGVFKELSSFEYKKGDNIKGTAYKKVSAALAAHTAQITSGKEAKKLAGIGKSSADKIDEFLSSGKVAKLEEYKQGV